MILQEREARIRLPRTAERDHVVALRRPGA